MERALRTNAAIENILKKYADTVYRIVFVRAKNKDDAEDITQEVFVRFIKRAPVFKSEEHEKAWFIRVAINCSKSLLLSPWRTRRSDTETDVSVFDAEKTGENRVVMTLRSGAHKSVYPFDFTLEVERPSR